MESTQSADISMKWKKIDITAQSVDDIDVSAKYVDEKSKYRHIL